jgi:hypothetical protein
VSVVAAGNILPLHFVIVGNCRFELALSVLVARGVVLEIPQLPGSNLKCSSMTETPASENEGTSSSPPCENDKVDQEIDEKSSTRSV